MHRPTFAELLAQTGLIDRAQLELAVREHQRAGIRLGRIVLDRGLADERALYEALARAAGVPRWSASQAPDRAAARWIEPHEATTAGVTPLWVDTTARRLVVAISDPTCHAALESVALRTGLQVSAVLASESELARLIEHQYGAPPGEAAVLGHLRQVFEGQQEGARALHAIFELCVARGIITREEYLERLRAADSSVDPLRGQP